MLRCLGLMVGGDCCSRHLLLWRSILRFGVVFDCWLEVEVWVASCFGFEFSGYLVVAMIECVDLLCCWFDLCVSRLGFMYGKDVDLTGLGCLNWFAALCCFFDF